MSGALDAVGRHIDSPEDSLSIARRLAEMVVNFPYQGEYGAQDARFTEVKALAGKFLRQIELNRQ